MFGAIKSLFFKNKNAIAENIWSQIGISINIAKKFGTYEDFNKEFFEDDYLVGYFNGYINFMIKFFFKVNNTTDSGFIIQKIMNFFDPIYSDFEEIKKNIEIIKKAVGKENTKLGSDHAFMTVATMLNVQEKNNLTNSKIYIEADKFYNDGSFLKRAEIQKKVLGSMVKNDKDPKKMPKNFAIAYRIFELSFVKCLNKKFKVKDFNNI